MKVQPYDSAEEKFCALPPCTEAARIKALSPLVGPAAYFCCEDHAHTWVAFSLLLRLNRVSVGHRRKAIALLSTDYKRELQADLFARELPHGQKLVIDPHSTECPHDPKHPNAECMRLIIPGVFVGRSPRNRKA